MAEEAQAQGAELPHHSPLGASGSYRWLRPPYGGGCAASPRLSRGVEDPESDYAAEGTAAHELAAQLIKHGGEAWQAIGQKTQRGIEVNKEMADAVQVYVDNTRERYTNAGGMVMVEQHIHRPDIHPMAYGTVDFAWSNKHRLDVIDYKHGAGIVVEARWNPQLMYYAMLVLQEYLLWSKVSEVVLRVVQPRGWHSAGPIRDWTVSTATLWAWVHNVLVPDMNNAMASTVTASGDHCRFCPARYRACPQLQSDADEIEEYLAMIEEKGGAAHLTNEQVERFLNLTEILKIAGKSAREVAFERAQQGTRFNDWKLVKAKADREWREGTKEKIEAKFGKAAYTQPELKSPAKIDKLPGGTDFTAEYAFKPDKGLQLAKSSDPRSEAGPSQKSVFKPQSERREKA